MQHFLWYVYVYIENLGHFLGGGVLKDKQIWETDVNEQISLRVVPLDMPRPANMYQFPQPSIQGHTSTT